MGRNRQGDILINHNQTDNANRQLTRQVILTNEETFAYKFNPNGFPTEVTLLSKNASGVTTSQTRTSYTYQCL